MPNGDAVANVAIATSESWKDQQGQMQERTEWHRLSMYRKLAEIAGEYLRKGAQIYVEGKLHTRKWQDQQEQDRYTTVVIVEKMQMLGGGNGNQPNNNQRNGVPKSRTNQANPDKSKARKQQPPMAEPDFDFDDDIPFAPLFKQYRAMHYAI